MVISTFEKGLEEISKIPDLEPKILVDLNKSLKNETLIRTPYKPLDKPSDPDPNERPRKYPDENKWIWDMLQDVQQKITLAMKPLDEYMVVFNQFKDILTMNPDEYIRSIDNSEIPWDVD